MGDLIVCVDNFPRHHSDWTFQCDDIRAEMVDTGMTSAKSCCRASRRIFIARIKLFGVRQNKLNSIIYDEFWIFARWTLILDELVVAVAPACASMRA